MVIFYVHFNDGRNTNMTLKLQKKRQLAKCLAELERKTQQFQRDFFQKTAQFLEKASVEIRQLDIALINGRTYLVRDHSVLATQPITILMLVGPIFLGAIFYRVCQAFVNAHCNIILLHLKYKLTFLVLWAIAILFAIASAKK